MLYKEIYSFQAMDEIVAGEVVKCFDLDSGECVTLNELFAAVCAKLIRSAEQEHGRYRFFATTRAEMAEAQKKAAQDAADSNTKPDSMVITIKNGVIDDAKVQ